MKLGFVGMLILVVVVGGAVGGAYAAGIAMGKNSAPAASQAPGAAGAADSGASAARAAAAAGGAGVGGAMGLGAGASAVMGTVEKMEGNVVTVSTQGGGSTQVTINENTAVRKLADTPKDELKQGVRVVVTGQQGTGGAVTASSIQIVAADASSPGSPQGGPARIRKPEGTQASQ